MSIDGSNTGNGSNTAQAGNAGHIAVLQAEAISALNLQPDGCYIDGTYGRGGHCGLILQQLGAEGRVIAIDQDAEAIADGRARFANEPRLSLHHDNFESLARVAEEHGVAGGVDGVLLDLGVSSPQLDVAARGFSFAGDGALDMRMDTGSGHSAAQWIATVDEQDLATVLREYGEERYAKRIAKAIVMARDVTPFSSTLQLANIIKEAHPRWDHHRHPATRSFQAIRIFINRELDVLHSALEHSVQVLRPGGRLAVISFHSLEDRIVKRFLRGDHLRQDVPRHLPAPEQSFNPMRTLKKSVPSKTEITMNPRSRSAVLRVGERLDGRV